MKKFYAEISIGEKLYITTIEAPSKQMVIDCVEKEGYKVEKIVDASTHHLCKYCGGIAEGNYEDLLCEECRYDFGHALFSEL